jgi:hypothetical protein
LQCGKVKELKHCPKTYNAACNSLLALQDKSINKKSLSIKRGVSGEKLKNSHMVFIGLVQYNYRLAFKKLSSVLYQE